MATLGPVVKETLKVSAHKLQADKEEHGKGWWGGVEYMARLPGIDVKISEEADTLRAQWIGAGGTTHGG